MWFQLFRWAYFATNLEPLGKGTVSYQGAHPNPSVFCLVPGIEWGHHIILYNWPRIIVCPCHTFVVGNSWSGAMFRHREEKAVTETRPSTVSLLLEWGWTQAGAQAFLVSEEERSPGETLLLFIWALL